MTTTQVTPAVTLRAAVSSAADPEQAADELLAQLGRQSGLYVVFVTSGHADDRLARRLAEAWGDRLIGCTGAGVIGPGGFDPAPVLAVALDGPDLRTRTLVVEPLSDLTAAVERVRPELAAWAASARGDESFAVLLCDGLSAAEEQLVANLKALLGAVPLIGGSAGDDLTFTGTQVLAGASFAGDRATLTLITTPAPFRTFRLHHHDPGDEVLVVTAADPTRRLVHEINGIPAAEAFAEAVGVPVGDLGPECFSEHPLVQRAAGDTWVRSISQVTPGGGLQLFAAIDVGAVLRLGRSRDPENVVRQTLDGLDRELGGVTGVLAFDCVLRRVEFGRSGAAEAVGRALREHHVFGVSTFGEQFDDFHMNQTMVGVAFGAGGRG